MTLTVRPTTSADLALVDALLARSYPVLLKPDYPPSVLVTALPLISRARPELLTCGTYYLVESAAGQVLGAGGWTRATPTGGSLRQGVAHIRHVVTDPAHTRKGVGRALMTRIVEAAQADGIHLLDCLSTRTAVPFYGAMGFEMRAETDIPLRPGITFPAIHMQRGI